MSEAAQHGDTAAVGGQPPAHGTGAFAGVGLFSGLGAVAAKSCCIFPLILASTGVGGAWLSQELMAFNPYFIGAAWLSVVLAWALAIRRKRAAACAPGRGCETVTARWSGLALLIISTLIVLLATVWQWIGPTLAQYLSG